jgi:hypothetical protein
MWRDAPPEPNENLALPLAPSLRDSLYSLAAYPTLKRGAKNHCASGAGLGKPKGHILNFQGRSLDSLGMTDRRGMVPGISGRILRLRLAYKEPNAAQEVRSTYDVNSSDRL